MFKPFSLNIRGSLREFNRPQVMGILNVTDDSFYEASRAIDPGKMSDNIGRMIDSGVDIIDIGAYSSRPGADDIPVDVETERILRALRCVRMKSQDVLVSVDSFRANVAEIALRNGADIINDISGGDLDADMWRVVAEHKAPYILMHMRGNPQTMQSMTDYVDVAADVIGELSVKIRSLRLMGVSDIIVDPGFGFSKALSHNFMLMKHLDTIVSMLDVPVLVGVSRKSMVYKTLGVTPAESLSGTVALNTIALMKGASVLRVHDVDDAIAAIRMVEACS